MFPAPQPAAQRSPQQPSYVLGGGAASADSQQGQGQSAPSKEQVLQQYGQLVQSLAQIAKQIMDIQAVADPEGQALLVPVAQSGKALLARISEISKRGQAGPGGAGQQEMDAGGGSPAPNPSEGAPGAMAA